MINEANCWPFNAVSAAPLIRGDFLYVATCSTRSVHRNGGYCLDADTGRLYWSNQTVPELLCKPKLRSAVVTSAGSVSVKR